jgi:lipopolysaccharide export system protein LptA
MAALNTIHHCVFFMRWIQKRPLYAAGVFLCALGLCAAAGAERADRNQPIYIQADHWTYDDLKQVSILTGRVVITQGTRILKGNRVVLREDPEGYYFLSSTAGRGAPAYFRSKRARVDEYVEGEGEQIDYDGRKEITTLLRHAVVRRVTGHATVIDEIRGDVIRYDGQNEIYTASGATDASGKSSSRVHAILSPRAGSGPLKEGASVPLDMTNTLSRKRNP